MFPAQRLLGDEVDATEMTGVEHLGQYVFEMTKAKIESLKAGGGPLPAVEETPEMMNVVGEDEGFGGEAAEEEDEMEDFDGVT